VDLKALPKVELHRHLEGSIRFETFAELARETGLKLPRRELRRRTSMKGEDPGFLRFLSKFELYRGLYPSREWIERVAFEAVEDAKKDGVVYLELRFSPTHFGRRLGARGEDVAAWVARGARKAGIAVRFIATYGRDFGVRGNEPTTRAVRGTDVFSGLDLAGNEAVSAQPFVPLFKKLGLPVTIHAGEAGGAANVRQAIEKFGALRIGHGVRAFDDADVIRLARRKKVHFELCPTSNIQTGTAPDWDRHPAWDAWDLGLDCSLNTDDPSISGIRLQDEYERARRAGWNEVHLQYSSVNAAKAAFIPTGRERDLLIRTLQAAWRKARGIIVSTSR
jgi:adenosine deaminase